MFQKIRFANSVAGRRRLYLASIFIIMVFTVVWLNTGFAVSSAFSSHKPGRGANVEANPNVSVYVKHAYKLDASSVSATLNGTAVAAAFQYKGFWSEDYDTAELTYIVTDEKEGTISFEAKNLQDGLQTVWVSIRGTDGTVLEEAWTFNVIQPPTIANVYPADRSMMTGLDKISAVITDNSAVNWEQVKLIVNGEAVNFNVDTAIGTVTYQADFPSKIYNVSLVAEDMVGNKRTHNWSFTVDRDAPIISNLRHFHDGMKITDGKLKFYVQLNDRVDIVDNVSLKLNGNPLTIEFRYAGEWSYDGDEYYIHSRKDAYVTYEGAVASGNHLLALYTEDVLGNKKEYLWSFSALKELVISKVAPVQYGVISLQPVISATVDAGPLESVSLQLDDVTVPHAYDSITGVISYTPPEPLIDESRYTVSLAVTDEFGQTANRSWSFYTNTGGLKDMADSNIASCTPCHSLYPFSGSAGPYEDVHSKKLSFGGTHNMNWDCANCHNYINVEAGCQQCHGDYLYTPPGYDYAPHGSTPTIRYQLTQFDVNYPIRIKENREMFDCALCHQPGVNITRKSGAALQTHDIPELHREPGGVCSACHSGILTREHAQPGRTGLDGNPVGCGTCHQSTATAVKTAISTKQRGCSSCHENAVQGTVHAEKHNTGLTGQCADCHGMNMMNETQYHNGDCYICHVTEDNTVQNAVLLQKESCFDCHTEAHGVYMYELRKDIPLYSGVDWGTPQAADIWAGEGWLPAELNDSAASMIFSSRAELDKDLMYGFYSQAMTDNGWTLLRSTYAAGSPYFELVYQKDRRYAAVWYFRGTVPNTDGSLGARLQIAYH